MEATPEKSKAELIKEQSNNLRGTIAEELTRNTAHFSEADHQLLKFHGIYEQDDRDLRKQLLSEKKDRYWFVMIRSKIPGGLINAETYLAFDQIASRYANNTLRITTRQDFQLHGVLKQELRTTLRAINTALITTLGACGDIERNVMTCPAPFKDGAHDFVQDVAHRLSDHLLPKTRAYHEIWLNGEKIHSTEPEHEPLYGKAYMPRKFKTAVALFPDNCVDIFTHDIGLVTVWKDSQPIGFNVLVGGGLGISTGIKETFPRLGSPVAFVTPEEVVRVAEIIVAIQRDHGDRKNRLHARLKYLVHDWGVERFQAEMARRLGTDLQPAIPLEGFQAQDHLGWQEQGGNRWFLGLFVENGRIKDTSEMQMKTGLRRVIEELQPGVRLTPQQNILLTDLLESQIPLVERYLKDHGIKLLNQITPVRRWSMACPALPTCGLAVTDSERLLPSVITQLEQEFERLGLSEEAIHVRMTGCPNGCTRPYVAELGLVGRSLNMYTVYIGGNPEGTRLSWIFADKVLRGQLVPTVVPLLTHFQQQRLPRERFGDFCARLGKDELQQLLPSPTPIGRRGEDRREDASKL